MNTNLLLLLSLILADTSTKALPRFADYAVPVHFFGKPAPVQMVRPQARHYRTELRRAEKRGPNFAGHFTLAAWGCGSECSTFAIINARTGDVYFPEQPAFVKLSSHNDEDALQFRRDSRLLIVNGFTTLQGYASGKGDGKSYYLWTGHRLRLVQAVPAHGSVLSAAMRPNIALIGHTASCGCYNSGIPQKRNKAARFRALTGSSRCTIRAGGGITRKAGV